MTRTIQALALLLLLLDATAVAAGTTHKLAVLFANNRGHDPDQALRYAERDAEKLHEVLTELGGFPEEDARLLLGADAPAVMAALDRAKRRIEQLAKGAGDKTLLLVYFSGHAEGDVLELGDTSLRFDELRDFLARSKADVRLAFLDSCQSGRLISAKGGRRGAAFRIDVTDEITSTGYAIITSSAHDELSQESAELRGAFFTHYLVSALRGAGDESGDGKVTLSEAYQYAYTRTLARTSATVGGSQHPMYHFRLEGRGDIVLTSTARSRAHIAVELPEPGRLMLLDGAGETILAEASATPGAATFLSVPPGEYLVYLIAPGGAVRSAQAVVGPNARTDLGPDDFETTTLTRSVAKGGLFLVSDEPWRHGIGAAGLWRLWPLAGGTASYGASLHYRGISPTRWQPTARISWATRDDVGLSTGYNDVGACAGIGRVLPARWILLRAELLAGYEHIFQDDRAGADRHTSGFDYLGMLGMEIPFETAFVSLDVGAGGRIFQIMGEGWVHRFDFQAALGFGVRWEAP
jgi:hypothetical protein